jgi:hypothetical protein
MTKVKKQKIQSKASFVRKLPADTPAKDVIAKAKAAGISVTESYVYSVRTTMKKARRRPPSPSSSPSSSAAAIKASGGPESVLRAVAAVIGLRRAIALLETERDRVQKLLRT